MADIILPCYYECLETLTVLLLFPWFEILYFGVNNLKFVNYESAVRRAADKSILGQ